MKTILAVNGSPRTGWNTAALVREAARGAEEAGARTEIVDLYRLEEYTGCVSCFGCKREPHLGECICRDGLYGTLEMIRTADGLILGSPNYLGDVSAGFRAFFERLIFPCITYKTEPRSYAGRRIPVLFIMDGNAPAQTYAAGAYAQMLERYAGTFEAFLGPVQTFICGDTLQVNDYDRYGWTMFDPAAKRARRETVFPRELEEVRRLGAALAAE